MNIKVCSTGLSSYVMDKPTVSEYITVETVLPVKTGIALG
jgi:hypothetical protein